MGGLFLSMDREGLSEEVMFKLRPERGGDARLRDLTKGQIVELGGKSG